MWELNGFNSSQKGDKRWILKEILTAARHRFKAEIKDEEEDEVKKTSAEEDRSRRWEKQLK